MVLFSTLAALFASGALLAHFFLTFLFTGFILRIVLYEQFNFLEGFCYENKARALLDVQKECRV
jgi:hypothetical protein